MPRLLPDTNTPMLKNTFRYPDRPADTRRRSKDGALIGSRNGKQTDEYGPTYARQRGPHSHMAYAYGTNSKRAARRSMNTVLTYVTTHCH